MESANLIKTSSSTSPKTTVYRAISTTFLDVKYWPLQEPLDRPHDILTTVWGGTLRPHGLHRNHQAVFRSRRWRVVAYGQRRRIRTQQCNGLQRHAVPGCALHRTA
ncbi:hypothetical protein MRX96_005672 [Rhipicephalus microplus]